MKNDLLSLVNLSKDVIYHDVMTQNPHIETFIKLLQTNDLDVLHSVVDIMLNLSENQQIHPNLLRDARIVFRLSELLTDEISDIQKNLIAIMCNLGENNQTIFQTDNFKRWIATIICATMHPDTAICHRVQHLLNLFPIEPTTFYTRSTTKRCAFLLSYLSGPVNKTNKPSSQGTAIHLLGNLLSVDSLKETTMMGHHKLSFVSSLHSILLEYAQINSDEYHLNNNVHDVIKILLVLSKDVDCRNKMAELNLIESLLLFTRIQPFKSNMTSPGSSILKKIENCIVSLLKEFSIEQNRQVELANIPGILDYLANALSCSSSNSHKDAATTLIHLAKNQNNIWIVLNNPLIFGLLTRELYDHEFRPDILNLMEVLSLESIAQVQIAREIGAIYTLLYFLDKKYLFSDVQEKSLIALAELTREDHYAHQIFLDEPSVIIRRNCYMRIINQLIQPLRDEKMVIQQHVLQILSNLLRFEFCRKHIRNDCPSVTHVLTFFTHHPDYQLHRIAHQGMLNFGNGFVNIAAKEKVWTEDEWFSKKQRLVDYLDLDVQKQWDHQFLCNRR